MINIGIIGAGRIVEWFIKDYLLIMNNINVQSRIISIWNRTYEKANLINDKYNLNLNVYQNLNDFFNKDRNNIDLIYIGTSDESHFDFVKTALENKINVFCEKPLSLSYLQSKELYKLANKNDLLLFEGIKTGFAPAFIKLEQIIKSELLGRIKYIYSSHAKISTSGNIPNDSNVGFHLAGGMYALYTVLKLAGKAKVVQFMNNAYEKNTLAIQTSVLTIRHSNNVISTVVGSDTITDDLSTKIIFEKGYAKLGGRIDLYNENYKKDSCHMPKTLSIYDNQNNLLDFYDLDFVSEGEGLRFEIEHVLEMLNDNIKESSIVSQSLSLEIIKILEKTNKVSDLESVVL
ncbi:hypothetical protein ESOMN_v1c05370 [Williamsoniiplasma somnilux]|uniref:Gfo/Idh/MocA-like oxidoreductase N-terminal domain-containing protein n=1 Tax=Williamsoniiplasma somnilux TaxID=215578 RepID=A0A2K8NYM1_9MOLU|nr:Gfo/Idh/MocA family oxidoreductase [Williamsoniiplasma somnilux]ATZ18919.1 hypothetical protein ESOMN_v1c05370 [Williamsoniiplasma somnilux]